MHAKLLFYHAGKLKHQFIDIQTYICTVGLHVILVRTSASACVERIISAEFAGVILNQLGISK